MRYNLKSKNKPSSIYMDISKARARILIPREMVLLRHTTAFHFQFTYVFFLPGPQNPFSFFWKRIFIIESITDFSFYPHWPLLASPWPTLQAFISICLVYWLCIYTYKFFGTFTIWFYIMLWTELCSPSSPPSPILYVEALPPIWMVFGERSLER